MSQSGTAEPRWLFQDTVKEEDEKQDLWKEKQRLAEERRKFEKEKREFYSKKQLEERRLAQEAKLFEMKWNILETELQKLAKEKEELSYEREKYISQEAERQESGRKTEIVRGEMFFSGVENVSAMKKRYKDLIKIFHPDNVDGDTVTLQEINREYDQMRKAFEA